MIISSQRKGKLKFEVVFMCITVYICISMQYMAIQSNY